jgi:MFS family permease
MKLDELEVGTASLNARVPRPAYAWYVVAVLTLAYVSSFIDRQILSLLVVPIRRDLGISDTQMSLLMGLSFALFYTVLGFPIGRLADSRSRRGIIAAGVAVWSLMTVACGFASGGCSWPGSESGWGGGVISAGVLLDRRLLPPRAARHRAQRLVHGDLPRFRAGVLPGRGHRRAHRQRRHVTTAMVGTVFPWQSVFFIVGLPGLAIALLMVTVRELPRRNSLHAARWGAASRRRGVRPDALERLPAAQPGLRPARAAGIQYVGLGAHLLYPHLRLDGRRGGDAVRAADDRVRHARHPVRRPRGRRPRPARLRGRKAARRPHRRARGRGVRMAVPAHAPGEWR